MGTRVVSQTINLQDIGQPIEKYITEITEGGIIIHPAGDINNAIQITNELDILVDGKPVASYGESTTIGSESGFHIVLGADENEGRLSFFQGPEEVAYITNRQLYITQSVVLQQMDIGTKLQEDESYNLKGGQWSWKVHENFEGKNNLYLKWLG